MDLIVAHEISSKAMYIKRYQRPEWPGAASGITVGIGYDLGYNTREQILKDWSNFLTPDVIRNMQRYAGITGKAAKAKLAEAKPLILVPWDAAMAVFMNTSMPKFEAIALRACPGSEKLPAGCFGVLTSLTYNRGASYSKDGDRYREMRNIRALIASGKWDKVPAELRSMKRLWPALPGLQRRRDEEAALWQASLRAVSTPAEEPSVRVDTGDDKSLHVDEDEGTLEGNSGGLPPPPKDTPINVQPPRGRYSAEVELIQRKLIALKYFEVGDPDGKVGGKFVAGVAAFMTDRGKDPNKGRITPELMAEISAASTERLPDGTPWSRPIAPTRANATASDIAPKVAAVKANWYQKVLAWVLGLPATAVAGIKGIFGDDSYSGYFKQIKDFLSGIPTEYYLLGIIALAIGIFLAAKASTDTIVKDYNEGKIN